MTRAQAGVSWFGDLRCPDDGHVLHRTGGPVPFAACRHCDGTWFTKEALDRRRQPSLPPAPERKRQAGRTPQNRLCPQCRIPLTPEDVDGVVIDVCATCGGVWLDPGEYPAARRRSVRHRLEREMPGFKRSSTKAGRFVNDMLDFLADVFTEEEPPEFSPRDLIPKRRPRWR